MPAPVIDINDCGVNSPTGQAQPLGLHRRIPMSLPQVVVPFAAGVAVTLLIMWICHTSSRKARD